MQIWAKSLVHSTLKFWLEKLMYILFSLLYFRFFWFWLFMDSNIVLFFTAYTHRGQKKWTFLFQQPIFLRTTNIFFFVGTCAFTNRKALYGTPTGKRCVFKLDNQTVDFWCGTIGSSSKTIYLLLHSR